MNNQLRVAISNAELSQWAEKRADDAGRVARELIAYRKGELPQDVINLVIAAREFWEINEDMSTKSYVLDKALEAFSERVPYENEPDDISAIEHVPPSEDDLVTPAYMVGYERGKDAGIAIGREQAAVIVEEEADKEAEQQKACFAIDYDNQGHQHARAQRRLREAASAIRAAKEGEK